MFSTQHLKSFDFSVFLEDITSDLKKRRRHSEHLDRPSPSRIKKHKVFEQFEHTTIDENEGFSLLKSCPRFDTYSLNNELLQLISQQEDLQTDTDKVKQAYYDNLVFNLSDLVNSLN